MFIACCRFGASFFDADLARAADMFEGLVSVRCGYIPMQADLEDVTCSLPDLLLALLGFDQRPSARTRMQYS